MLFGLVFSLFENSEHAVKISRFVNYFAAWPPALGPKNSPQRHASERQPGAGKEFPVSELRELLANDPRKEKDSKQCPGANANPEHVRLECLIHICAAGQPEIQACKSQCRKPDCQPPPMFIAQIASRAKARNTEKKRAKDKAVMDFIKRREELRSSQRYK